MKSQGNRNFFESVKHCLAGFAYTIKKERNFKIEVILAIVTLLMSFILSLTLVEFIIVLLCIGLILSLELLNTAIERCVDLVTPNYHELAKYAKDTAAASVFISSLVVAVVGVLIFLPKILEYL